MNRESIVELVAALEMEVNNGGLDQFFFNSAGNHTRETIAALVAIGASHTAGILKAASAKFPDGSAPEDWSRRQAQLLIVSPDSEAFEAEDAAFYEYRDDLQGLVDTFVQ